MGRSGADRAMSMQEDTRRVVWLGPQDMPRWDRFVDGHPFGWLCQRSAWKDVLESSFGHIRGHFCAVIDDRSGDILSGIPVYTVKSWLLGNRLVSVPFATLCDPLVSSPDDMSKLSPFLLRRSEADSAASIEVRSLRSEALIQIPGVGVSRFYKHHFLRLDRSLEELRKSFHNTSVRQRINRAERNHVEVRRGDSVSDLSSFCSILDRSRRRLALPSIPFRFFNALWDAFYQSGHLVLLLATHDGRLVGGMLSLKHQKLFTVEYSAEIADTRRLGVNQTLYWAAIKEAHRGGQEIFSFGRTSPNNKGLLAYKSCWGTSVEELPTFFFPETACRYVDKREESFQHRFIKKIAGTAPLPVCRCLGEFCYRHMG